MNLSLFYLDLLLGNVLLLVQLSAAVQIGKEMGNNLHFQVKQRIKKKKLSHSIHLSFVREQNDFIVYMFKSSNLQPLHFQFPTFSTGHHLANISSHIITDIWTSEHTAQPSYGWRAFMRIHATHLYIHLITLIKMGEQN